MKLDINKKITINGKTYRGGDELPQGYGGDGIKTTETPEVEKRPAKKAGGK